MTIGGTDGQTSRRLKRSDYFIYCFFKKLVSLIGFFLKLLFQSLLF